MSVNKACPVCLRVVKFDNIFENHWREWGTVKQLCPGSWLTVEAAEQAYAEERKLF